MSLPCGRTGASLRKQIIENIMLTLAENISGDDYNNSINEKNVSNQTKKWDECPTYVQDGTDASSKLEDLIQDVEKAMYIDETRGALAVNTVATGIDTDNGWLQPYGMAEFTFEVQYRYLYGNP